MDLAAILQSDRGSLLDPWPAQPEPASDLLNTPSTTNQNSSNTSETLPGVQARSNFEYLPEHNRCSRWVGRDFNFNGSDKRPAKLMSSLEMETSRKIALHKLHSAVFELNYGDTMVFIDYPVAKRYPASQADCQGVTYRSQQVRVHSQKLLATGSSRFKEMLSPTYQFRVLRRRGMVNQLPEAIKYVLDLSPAFEGEQLVFEIAELSLTPGITKWWTSEMSYRTDPWLVSGHDDVCACLKEQMETADSQEEPGSPWSPSSPRSGNNNTAPRFPNFPYAVYQILEKQRKGENEVYPIPNYRKLPDYCPIRHRNSLVRLLMIIEGMQVPLDSASRVWTLVNLAKIWDCPSVMRDQVAQWIMHGQNTRFIEVLPEEALQLGTTLELPEVTQCAFRILVNELALKQAARNSSAEQLRTVSVFGRRLGDLPDELSNIVQHAARSLVERKTKLCSKLYHASQLDLSSSKEWNTLRRIERLLENEPEASSARALGHVRELIRSLHQDMEISFTEEGQKFPVSARSYLESIDEDRVTYVEPRDFNTTRAVLELMTPVQRMLCPFVYNEFGERLDEGLHYSVKYGWDTMLHQCLPYLLRDLRFELEKMVRANPQLQQSPEWAPILNIRRVLGWDRSLDFVKDPLISLDLLEREVKDVLRPITLSWERTDIEPPLNITRHLLLNLEYDEMKFLPLWAGGSNDGTGGVFESFLPPAELGPVGPGPSYHTGITIPSAPASISSSMMDDMRTLKVAGSTTAGSLDVRDSVSTVYNPNHVIADGVSVGTESFTLGVSEYEGAKYEVPADHQQMGESLALAADASDKSDTESQITATELVGLTSDGDDDMSFWEENSNGDDFSDMEM